MLTPIKRLIPSSLRDKWRPWKHHLEEVGQEISFCCHPTQRREKKAHLKSLKGREDLFQFARKEFWISQNREEILPLIELLQERDPRVVGEIGTYLSGNSFLFNQTLQRLSLQILVDLKVKNKLKLQYYAPSNLSLVCVDGFSCDAYTLHQVARALGDLRFDFLFIDGDHEYAGVRQDLLEYAQWVRPGGLVAFHDIVPDHFVRYGRTGPFYAGEVYLLWRQLKARFRHWEFVADPDQNGAGIGVIEFDDQAGTKLADIRSLTKDQR
jgi:predicted O-methyltransferase YrrM